MVGLSLRLMILDDSMDGAIVDGAVVEAMRVVNRLVEVNGLLDGLRGGHPGGHDVRAAIVRDERLSLSQEMCSRSSLRLCMRMKDG